jgi:hypothetical protein
MQPACAHRRKAQVAESRRAAGAGARGAAQPVSPGAAREQSGLARSVQEKNFAAAFAHFDTDGSGSLTADEIRAALAALGVTDDEVQVRRRSLALRPGRRASRVRRGPAARPYAMGALTAACGRCRR